MIRYTGVSIEYNEGMINNPNRRINLIDIGEYLKCHINTQPRFHA